MRALGDEEMAPVREALEVFLDGYRPYPASLTGRHREKETHRRTETLPTVASMVNSPPMASR